jgi:UDP-2,3-diacylglucosamine hydrolase
MSETVFIISDAHIGAQSAGEEGRKVSLLRSFLHHVAGQSGRLIINGDLFDFWFEYRHAVPRRHFHLIAQLAQMAQDGTGIDYVAGNHDFWLGSFMSHEVGLRVHRDALDLRSAGRRIHIRHGDGLLKKDHAYRMLKKVLRHPLNIFLYRLLHPDVGVPLALHFSQMSRNADKNGYYKTDQEYRAWAFRKMDEGYDGVVLGHSHIPALVQHGRGWYGNAGNWIHSFTFLKIEDGQPELYRWDGAAVPLPADAAERRR